MLAAALGHKKIIDQARKTLRMKKPLFTYQNISASMKNLVKSPSQQTLKSLPEHLTKSQQP